MRGIYPVGDALVVHSQHLANTSHAHAFQVQTQGLLFGLFVITHRFTLGSEIAHTLLTAHTLRAGVVEACFDHILLTCAIRARWQGGKVALHLCLALCSCLYFICFSVLLVTPK